jgi:hypothetical protein
MKKLEIFPSMGGTYGVGWMRDDAPMIHLFANAKSGESFRPASGPEGGPHWPCEVCEAHGYSEKDFHAQIGDALERGPHNSNEA